MKFDECPLDEREYFKTETKKDAICIHHTAGSHHPKWTIHGWNTDRSGGGSRIRVATHYVIGGISTSTDDDTWDGVIVKCMGDDYFAHHLGIKAYNNTHLNKKTFGIEICNFGPLKKSRDGKYYNYINKQVPENQVCDLGEEFRGYRYYHKYTENQIKSLKNLLNWLSKKYSIDLKEGLQERLDYLPEDLSILEQQKWLNSRGYKGANGKSLTEDGISGNNTNCAIEESKKNAFEISDNALDGSGGLWSHSSYRKDKFDCSPQPELIKIIKSF